ARADPVRDRPRERHREHGDERGNRLLVVLPRDVRHERHHVEPDDDERGRRGLRRDHGSERREPHRGEEQDPDDDRHEAGAPTLETVPGPPGTTRARAKSPTRSRPNVLKSGTAISVVGICAAPGVGNPFPPATSVLSTTAITVVATMPIRSAPRTRRAISHADR